MDLDSGLVPFQLHDTLPVWAHAAQCSLPAPSLLPPWESPPRPLPLWLGRLRPAFATGRLPAKLRGPSPGTRLARAMVRDGQLIHPALTIDLDLAVLRAAKHAGEIPPAPRWVRYKRIFTCWPAKRRKSCSRRSGTVRGPAS